MLCAECCALCTAYCALGCVLCLYTCCTGSAPRTDSRRPGYTCPMLQLQRDGELCVRGGTSGVHTPSRTATSGVIELSDSGLLMVTMLMCSPCFRTVTAAVTGSTLAGSACCGVDFRTIAEPSSSAGTASRPKPCVWLWRLWLTIIRLSRAARALIIY